MGDAEEKGKGKEERGCGNKAGGGYGTAAVKQHHMGNINGSDKARRKRAWEKESSDGATEPPLAAAGAARRDKGDAVRDLRRRTSEITRSDVAPAVMVVTADPPGWEGLPENLGGGGSITMTFLGLMDSTQLSGVARAPQRVALPNHQRESGEMVKRYDQLDNGGGGRTPPPTKREMGTGQMGLKGYL